MKVFKLASIVLIMAANGLSMDEEAQVANALNIQERYPLIVNLLKGDKSRLRQIYELYKDDANMQEAAYYWGFQALSISFDQKLKDEIEEIKNRLLRNEYRGNQDGVFKRKSDYVADEDWIGLTNYLHRVNYFEGAYFWKKVKKLADQEELGFYDRPIFFAGLDVLQNARVGSLYTDDWRQKLAAQK